MRAQSQRPGVPPMEMPPARTVRVADRGEFFLRDTGGDGPPVMLLHGWMASADLNWAGAYRDLQAAGYRVLAIDHRGHARGLRQLAPFRLVDCAADAAAVLRETGATPATIVGYSMGGAVAQLLGRDHPDVAGGVVLSGTAQHWQDPRTRRSFRAMGALGLGLSVAPRRLWGAGLERIGIRDSQNGAWIQSELLRHSARDIAEAGRELGRFDSRPWLSTLTPPVAVVITTRDDVVSPRKQRQLAEAAGGPVFEAECNHMEVVVRGKVFNPPLLEAIAAVSRTPDARAA
ncbi:MAG: lysophospholipase [Actinomycetota bacterium]|nr:lysophospholipase [Actinomycetota bacterium]